MSLLIKKTSIDILSDVESNLIEYDQYLSKKINENYNKTYMLLGNRCRLGRMFEWRTMWSILCIMSQIFIFLLSLCNYCQAEEHLMQFHHHDDWSETGGQNAENDRLEEDKRLPCIYQGHLRSDKNWYGYLANISVAGGTAGRMEFEFSYPADKCCQNVLFYYEDQIAVISQRMNCWQKEYLLRPEEDQILRLTPSFSWSGCETRRTTAESIERHIVCKGGRSFAARDLMEDHRLGKDPSLEADKSKMNRRTTAWFIAVSNCGSLHGIDLKYRIEIFGHNGPCYANEPFVFPSNQGITTTECPTLPGGANVHLLPSRFTPRYEDDIFGLSVNEPLHGSVCVLEGNINTSLTWFGFMRNFSLEDGGGFRFRFSYPYSMQTQNVILYDEDDVQRLHWEQICWLKESVIDSRHVHERILDLSFRSSWNGCTSRLGPNIEGNNLTCQGEKIFNGPRRLHLALSNCRSREGLLLTYRLEVFGYDQQEGCPSYSPHIKISIYYIPFNFIIIISFYINLKNRNIV